MKINDALKLGCQSIGHIASRPKLESEILLAYVLGKDRLYLHSHDYEELNAHDQDAFFLCIDRRIQGEPIEYITQSVSFYSRDFFVDHGALIPRPESEILIDRVQDLIIKQGISEIVEVGVGSGALICTLALLHPSLHFHGSDISDLALKVAQANIDRYHLSHQVTLHHTSFLESIKQPFELLYSNPPYIKYSYPLPLSVTFEPKEALFGGIYGDEIIKALLVHACKRHIRFVVCEIGYDQKDAIYTFIKQLAPYQSLEFYQDLAGLDRGFMVKFS